MTTPATDDGCFLSVDWGTSRLRVRCVRREPLEVLAEASSDDGVAAVHRQWSAVEHRQPRAEFFADRLAALRDSGLGDFGPSIKRAPAMVSGMASSTLGMAETPYAECPIPAAGGGLVTRQLDRLAPFPGGLLLVSGVATEHDVIRGEETELAGLILQGFGDGLYVLPGTHAKHLLVRGGELVEIRTHLTGELLNLLATDSVLSETIGDYKVTQPGTIFREAAREAAADRALLRQLFRVRARSLLHGATPQAGAERLCGLLIGSELAGLAESAERVVLSANDRLRPLYAAAIKETAPGVALQIANRQQHVEAVPRAHAALLDRLANK